MGIDLKCLKELEAIKAKIKKQKIGTIAEIEEYNKLFAEYIRLSKELVNGKMFYIEERLKDLELQVFKMKENNKQFLTNNGYITTEDVLKAICKHLNIDIAEIDNTPTVKK